MGERKPSGASTDSPAPMHSPDASAQSAHLRAIAAWRAQRLSRPSAEMWRNCSVSEYISVTAGVFGVCSFAREL